MQKRAKTSKMRDDDKNTELKVVKHKPLNRGRGKKKARKIKGEDGNMRVAQLHL